MLDGSPDRQFLELRRQQWVRRCRSDFHSFCVEVLDCHVPRQEPAAHHRLFIQEFEQAARGRVPKLMVAAPPGSAKSTYTQLLVAWFLAAFPGSSVLLCAHTDQLAASNSIAVQRIVTEHHEVLGFKVTSDAAGDWRTSNRGRVKAVGSGAAATGFRAQLIVVDDPVKGVEAAYSDLDRERLWRWYLYDIETRRTPGCGIILISTRWHEDDLAGRLLRVEPETWRNIRIPAISEGDADPLHRAEGTPRWADQPEYGYAKELIVQRDAHDRNGQSALWHSLYQGSPRPPEGNLFKVAAIPVYDILPGRIVREVRAHDFASSTKGDADYTATVKLAQLDTGSFAVTHVARGRHPPHEVERVLVEVAKFDGRQVPIFIPEDPGSAGQALAHSYIRLLEGHMVTAIRMTGDKEFRARAVAAQANIGRVGVLRDAGTAAFLDELQSFPGGRHDDMVDALSLAFDRMVQGAQPLNISEEAVRSLCGAAPYRYSDAAMFGRRPMPR